jgi:hypothetical protein
MSPERFLLIASASLALLTGLTAFLYKTGRELRKVSRTMDDFGGTPARPGHPATKGVFERMQEQDTVLAAVVEVVEKVSARQEEIAAIATKAAQDVQAVLGELTTNGGASTKDQAKEAARLAAVASLTAEETRAIAQRTEDLLRRHMLNGVEIMEIGERNDRAVIAAIEQLGGTVDHHPFPVVDDGSM